MKLLDGPDFFRSSLFCDDIRQEVAGKLTLVGVYQDRVLVHSDFPCTLPTFGVLTSYWQWAGAHVQPTKVRVYLPGDEDEHPTIEGDVEYAPPEFFGDDPATALTKTVLVLKMAPIEFRQAGRIRVRMDRGDAWVKLGAIVVDRFPEAVSAAPGADVPA
jgi:hypothetical protein